MPSDDFTKSYVALTDTTETFTNVALVGNFVMNVFLTGAMTFLWSMLNCLQIVSHFDLVNIVMPANAHVLFKILVQIATFDILPVETFISDFEDSLGIVNDSFALTPSFIDFEFDSSGPIDNLQIIFLAMVLLLLVPIILLIIKGIFFWSKKIQRGINCILGKLCFNVYIRFGLEAYLELSICSMLRFSNFTFGTSSEKFHSLFATTIFVSLIFFLVFALFFLQLRFARLSSAEAGSRYGDLFLSLKTSERTAILSPFIFMLRRLLYAITLVSLSEHSYFQI